jgi:hypothetical protein
MVTRKSQIQPETYYLRAVARIQFRDQMVITQSGNK